MIYCCHSPRTRLKLGPTQQALIQIATYPREVLEAPFVRAVSTEASRAGTLRRVQIPAGKFKKDFASYGSQNVLWEGPARPRARDARTAVPRSLAISGNNFVVNCVTGCRPRVFSVASARRSVSSRLLSPLASPPSSCAPAIRFPAGRPRGLSRPLNSLGVNMCLLKASCYIIFIVYAGRCWRARLRNLFC